MKGRTRRCHFGHLNAPWGSQAEDSLIATSLNIEVEQWKIMIMRIFPVITQPLPPP